MPVKNSKSMKIHERGIPASENQLNELPPPQTTSTSRVIKKTLKAREEDKGDENIEPLKIVTEKQKSLEKIHSKSLTKEIGKLS